MSNKIAKFFSLKTLNSFIFTVFKFFIYLSIIACFIGAGATIGIVKTFSKQLPEIGYHTYAPSINTFVYDCNGNILTEIHETENRKERVPLARIPQCMQNAIIAIEDGRFYKHYGIDPIRIVAAMLKNIRKKRITGGASTITQQLARNAFLTFDQTYTRKIKEILLAFKIEKKFTKQEILELYLNEIYFGHGAWGIASAASIYFDKKADELTLSESAILASLPKSPTKYDPYRNQTDAKKRQILVLNMMKSNGFITEKQANEAKLVPIKLSSGKKSKRKTSYFIEYVKNELINKFGEKQVYTKGLKVYTTLNPKMQKAAEEAFYNAPIFKERPLTTHPTLQGGLLALEPTTGYIKAMVGGRDFKQSEFNRCTQAHRQPGSSFKPFVYLSAIDSGINANELFIDEPLEVVNRYSKKVWRPKNYGNRYVGPVTLKEALIKSLNTIAVKIAQRVGPQKIISYAKRMGINSPIGPHLAISLGAVDVTLLEMATGYATIANEGIKVKPIAITKVLDSKGNQIYKAKYHGEQVVSESSTYILLDFMKAVVQRGTGTRARLKGRPCAGKTGTTNNYIDAWFCGFTPNLVACVYVGHDDRQPLGPRMAGGTVAAPIWKLFMEEALKDTPVVQFRRPKNIIMKSICRDSGHIPSKYCDRSMMAAFKIGTEPDEYCASHMATQTSENFFENDGTYVIKPHKIENYTGKVLETTNPLEDETKIVPPIAQNEPDISVEEPLQRKKRSVPRKKPKFNTRSRFQNRH